MGKGRPAAGRLARLGSRLSGHGLDALVVTNLTNVRYLTGFTGSSGALVAAPSGAVLVTDFRYMIQAGKQVDGCRLVEQRGSLLDAVAKVLRRRRCRKAGFEGRHLTWAAHRDLSRRLPGVRLVAREGDVESLRMTKDGGEVSAIRQAVDISRRAYGKAARRLLGRRERDVAAGLEGAMKELGAEGESFPTIVASGANGALPHAVPGGRTIRRGSLVVIDFGARCRGYHADLTRTRLPGGGAARAKGIYRLVLEAQQAALESVRPGVEARVIDEAARSVISKGGFGEFFGHGTGHGVGLEVHEGPSISPRSGDVIAPGMVFTLEPGIYIEKFGGVRIEDMVLVTDKGCEILTDTIPKETF